MRSHRVFRYDPVPCVRGPRRVRRRYGHRAPSRGPRVRGRPAAVWTNPRRRSRQCAVYVRHVPVPQCYVDAWIYVAVPPTGRPPRRRLWIEPSRGPCAVRSTRGVRVSRGRYVSQPQSDLLHGPPPRHGCTVRGPDHPYQRTDGHADGRTDGTGSTVSSSSVQYVHGLGGSVYVRSVGRAQRVSRT